MKKLILLLCFIFCFSACNKTDKKALAQAEIEENQLPEFEKYLEDFINNDAAAMEKLNKREIAPCKSICSLIQYYLQDKDEETCLRIVKLAVYNKGKMTYGMDISNPLIESCKLNYYELTEYLLTTTAKDIINYPYSQYAPALFWALKAGNVELTELLLKNGADPKSETQCERTYMDEIEQFIADKRISPETGNKLKELLLKYGKFEIRTDTSVPLKSWQNKEYLKNNSLVAVEDGKISDKFVTKDGALIKNFSVENNLITIKTSSRNLDSGPSAPYGFYNIVMLDYQNGKFSEVLSYPEELGGQSNPEIKLNNAKINPDKVELSYYYQALSDAKYAGFGTVSFELNKIKNGYWYVSNYDCDVKGYFRKIDEEYSLPSEDGKIIVERNISKLDFFSLFQEYQNKIIYDVAEINNICLVYENLRLREKEDTSSSIIKTMKAGEYVKIIEVGKYEVIDEIPGNWCYVEIVVPEYMWDIKRKIQSTGTKGWCFSGFLK